MTRILGLFQIKTVRSAWVFLFGSALLFLFGIFQMVMFPAHTASDPGRDFEITFLSFWFLIAGIYMAVASWALFSARGREYLEAQELIPIKGNRTILWYIKFLFACYAAALATMMFLGVLSLPFAGFAGLEAMFSSNFGLYMLIAGLVWSPLIFRHLK
jgi:hypothetical protein